MVGPLKKELFFICGFPNYSVGGIQPMRKFRKSAHKKNTQIHSTDLRNNIFLKIKGLWID